MAGIFARTHHQKGRSPTDASVDRIRRARGVPAYFYPPQPMTDLVGHSCASTIHGRTRISHRCEQLHGQHACVEGAHVLGWLPTEATRGLNCFGIARGGASGPRLASQGGTARRYPGVSSRIIIPRRAEGGRPQQIHFYTRFPHSVRYAQLWRRLPWVVAWLLRNWDGTDEPELPVSGP